MDAEELLRLAGAAEDASEHPIAAIAAGAGDSLGGLPAVQGFANAQGLGVSGVVDGHTVAAGRADWLESEWAWKIPAELAAHAEAADAPGGPPFTGWDGQACGVLIVADTIKPTSAEAIRRLRGLGLRPVLLTGNNDRAARLVVNAIGVREAIARVLPAGKVEALRRLQNSGRVVAMAGDGVNDAATTPPTFRWPRWGSSTR